MNPRFHQLFATFLLIAAVFIFLQQQADTREMKQVEVEIANLRETWLSKSRAGSKFGSTESSDQSLPAAANLNNSHPPDPAGKTAAAPEYSMPQSMLRAGFEVGLQNMRQQLDLNDGQIGELRKINEDFLARIESQENVGAAADEYKNSMTEIIGSDNMEKLKQLQREKVETSMKREREKDLAYYQDKLKFSEQQAQGFSAVLEQADQIFIDAATDVADRQAEFFSDPQVLVAFLRKVKEQRRTVLTEKSRAVLNDDQYNAFLELLNNSPSPNPLFGAF